MSIYSQKCQKSLFGPPLPEFSKIEIFFTKTLVWEYNASFKNVMRWFRKKHLLLNSSTNSRSGPAAARLARPHCPPLQIWCISPILVQHYFHIQLPWMPKIWSNLILELNAQKFANQIISNLIPCLWSLLRKYSNYWTTYKFSFF